MPKHLPNLNQRTQAVLTINIFPLNKNLLARQNINNAIFEQMADFPFFQPGNNNSGNSLTNQVNTYKQFYREKEKRDVEYEFHVISNIYKTSANAVKSIWNKIGFLFLTAFD